jgi:hypothetical protein
MADAELISQTAYNKIKALYKTDIRKNIPVPPVKVTSDALRATGKGRVVDPTCEDRTIIVDDHCGITPKPIKKTGIKKAIKEITKDAYDPCSRGSYGRPSC